jgi:hypothetical protein
MKEGENSVSNFAFKFNSCHYDAENHPSFIRLWVERQTRVKAELMVMEATPAVVRRVGKDGEEVEDWEEGEEGEEVVVTAAREGGVRLTLTALTATATAEEEEEEAEEGGNGTGSAYSWLPANLRSPAAIPAPAGDDDDEEGDEVGARQRDLVGVIVELEAFDDDAVVGLYKLNPVCP